MVLGRETGAQERGSHHDEPAQTYRKEHGMSTTNFSTDPGTTHSGPGESSGAKEKAQQAAGTASQEGQRVAGVAKGEIKNVAGEAQYQLRGLLDQATSQVDEQSREQKGRLAETVRTFGNDLRGMTESQDGNGGLAAQLVQQVADQAQGLASHLESREPSELLEDARRFARRRPGAFLLGALAAGVVVGRVARGAKSAQDGPSATGGNPSRTVGNPALAAGPTPSPAYVTDESTSSTIGEGHTRIHAETDLGPQGVAISESGVPSGRGPA
jgi:hypothetical protein